MDKKELKGLTLYAYKRLSISDIDILEKMIGGEVYKSKETSLCH